MSIRRRGPAAEGRERVVAAALGLLDEVGLDGLTMRALADRLGMRAASLYWYIRDKEQLLGLLAAAILAELPAPSERPWREHLETFAADYRRVLQAHRDAARIVIEVQPEAPGLYERLIIPLLDAGFDGGVAVEACRLLAATYVPAAVAGEQGPRSEPAAEPGELRAPLGALTAARLEVVPSVADVTLRGDAGLTDLVAARFTGLPATLEVNEGSVRIMKRFRMLGMRSEPGEVELNTTIPWELSFGDAWRLDADLRGIRLGGVFVNGSASRVGLRLPPPQGTVPVRFRSAHKVTIMRPPRAAVRVRLRPGGAKVAFDTLRLNAAGETDWETPDFAAAEHRYDVEVGGGASELTVTVDEAGDVKPRPGQPGAAPAATSSALADAYPTLAAAALEAGDVDADARFEFGLRLLLDGLERRRAQP